MKATKRIQRRIIDITIHMLFIFLYGKKYFTAYGITIVKKNIRKKNGELLIVSDERNHLIFPKKTVNIQ